MITNGEWFAVPLKPDGWAVGYAMEVRSDGFSAYFFGPLRTSVPGVDELTGLRPADSVLVKYDVSLLGFSREGWIVIGESKRQESWPRLEEWHVQWFHLCATGGHQVAFGGRIHALAQVGRGGQIPTG